jgi:hypothetical protein
MEFEGGPMRLRIRHISHHTSKFLVELLLSAAKLKGYFAHLAKVPYGTKRCDKMLRWA